MQPTRQKIIIKGQVQGVGFRPHVFRVANSLALSGFVLNDGTGVTIEIQGDQLEHFLDHLIKKLPPLAEIHAIEKETIPYTADEFDFQIYESVHENSHTLISPDVTVCDACLSELLDKNNRYYQYPFLNCTQCGPRYTITRQLPYDRSQTAMSDFKFCIQCESEYLDPNNRRYHAQPTACEQCGPKLSKSIQEIAKAILDGKIVALKGLGGYQLVCDATDENAIKKLRIQKQREAKPFALMMQDCETVEKYCHINLTEKTLLQSRERPIVLLKKRNHGLSNLIAPELSNLGVMLPSTPLHYLLFQTLFKKNDNVVLIVTSANVNSEPIIINDQEAEEKLALIADVCVSYNRDIVTRVDDSLVRVINKQTLFIRRARGYVPKPILLSHEIPTTLAFGAHRKNTFCITRGNEAFVSQHIGSMKNRATIDFFHETLSHLLRFLSVKPERIAHDMHPDFYTTQLAEGYNLPAIPVQHHYAHMAAVAAEYGIKHPVIGVVLDGYGYGLDGSAWGGELLFMQNNTISRIGHLYPLLQPGGDRVAKEPWRMAASVLFELGKTDQFLKQFSNEKQALNLISLIEKNISLSRTSSCGRLFDAAAAILNVKKHSQYEGHAAQYLESLVTNTEVLKNGWIIKNNILDFLTCLSVLSEINDPVLGSNLFHGTLITGLTEWILENAIKQNVNTVLLSGGCFLNKVLSEGLIDALHQCNITALLPKQLPPNDGGISLGQAWMVGNICV